ncbi:MAG TPA: ChbG/HpnK family deacetylase [Tepidisphaeraceae bacterium]|jgi:hypothetical protein|nr:ChbG/HpnK family deacetylase [Tepidisphaeraceae bacterium]
MIELLIRGDDSGGSVSANRAVVECHRHGVLNNASVMAVGGDAALRDAVQRFAGLPALCIGLHLTLNSEWTVPRFRPCLPPEQVRSLLDGDGTFLPSPSHIAERGVDLDEMMKETRAQLSCLRAAGLSPTYLDEHMGVGWLPGLADRLARMCEVEGLVWARDHAAALPHAEPSAKPHANPGRAEGWLRRLEAALPGRYVLVTHPLVDDSEARAIHRPADPPGAIAADRDMDRQALLNPNFNAFCRSGRVRLQRYDD